MCKSHNITIITRNVIERYSKLNPNLSPNTLARNINVFREFCIYLKFQNINCYQIPKNSYPQKTRQYVPHIYSDNEIKLILKNIDIVSSKVPYSYIKHITIPLIIRILYQTGMRIGEVLNLNINDYDKDNKVFIIRNSKNGEERLIYLPDSLNNKISKYHQKFHINTENKYFFQITKTKISEETVSLLFKKAIKLSNIEITDKKPRIHDLRHTFIVKNIVKAHKNGKDFNTYLPYLQAYVGHKSITSLEYYFHLTKPILNELQPIINKKLGYLIPVIKDDNYE